MFIEGQCILSVERSTGTCATLTIGCYAGWVPVPSWRATDGWYSACVDLAVVVADLVVALAIECIQRPRVYYVLRIAPARILYLSVYVSVNVS